MRDNYGTVNPRVIEELENGIGKERVVADREKMIDYSHDEFSQTSLRCLPDAVVKPATREHVAQIMEVAFRENIPVTPRGGGTGLCGGCVPAFGGIVLSLENMNAAVEVDRENLMAVAEAGVRLKEFYEAVEGAGLFFPPHPGEENATVGGVIATNAGGARAVKYGVVRNFVRGADVVLPDGEILEIGGKLIKSSTGYSLLHLLIGSEGTLGIITRATLSLLPPPGLMYTLVAPYESLEDAIRTVPQILLNGILPMAVEFVDRDVIRVTEAYLDRRWPTPKGKAYLMIIVDGSGEEELLALAERVGSLCRDMGASEIFVADTPGKQRNLLEIRSQIYEALREHMIEILDISIPRARIADFVRATTEVAEQVGIWLPSYGHAADGNVHTHIMKAALEDGVWKDIVGWEEKYQEARDRLHELGRSYGGTISGEHGIGMVKRKYLASFLGSGQIRMMRLIKEAFDPLGILNPGKVI